MSIQSEVRKNMKKVYNVNERCRLCVIITATEKQEMNVVFCKLFTASESSIKKTFV